ncbi:MAG: ImmA/IrrE family metallo-endopeptidase [Eubacteriales bacterium]|nr:ImmA/IrrE family metallo-endopeptidase [Eubacteriales bacterium]
MTTDEVMEVKNLAREKRADFGIAPIGTRIFTYLANKEKGLHFECQPFDNADLDAFIIWPDSHIETAYIVLNSNQSLLNQIFATAHEYYHYLKDFQKLKEFPQICSLSQVHDKRDQKANRFAAEFLLPAEALKIEVARLLTLLGKDSIKKAELVEFAAIVYTLTIQYALPLKAVLYRLYEEGYINDINLYIENYAFIKKILTESSLHYNKQFSELLGCENHYIDEPIYDLMTTAYEHGFVSLDQLENDIRLLGLNSEFLNSFVIADDEFEELDIADSLKNRLRDKLKFED